MKVDDMKVDAKTKGTTISRRAFVGGSAALATTGCASNVIGRDYSQLDMQAQAVRAQLFQTYPNSRSIANLAAGHIVFPYVGKAGLLLGGSHGKGALFVRENIVGHYQVTAISAGLQAGVQTFSMILFFMTPEALASFRSSLGFELGTDVEYALPNKGVSIGASSATYNKPVYALISNQAGIMGGVSVEGAKYSQY